MRTGRLEAFSDGVLAIIITVMVLDLKVPHGASLAEIRPLLPVLLWRKRKNTGWGRQRRCLAGGRCEPLVSPLP